MPLAASAEHAEPQPFDLLAKGFQASPMQRHGMVRIVATQDPAQPGPLFRDRLMPVLPEGVLDLRQLGPHPFLIGIASELELAVPAGTTDVREPKKRERFGSPLPPSGSIAGRIAPKLDEAGFLRMEVQGKGGEAFL